MIGKKITELRKDKKEREWDRVIKSGMLKCGWIELAKVKFRWHSFIQMTINLANTSKTSYFLTSFTTVRLFFSKSNLEQCKWLMN
jgi:hypothetical protein